MADHRVWLVDGLQEAGFKVKLTHIFGLRLIIRPPWYQRRFKRHILFYRKQPRW